MCIKTVNKYKVTERAVKDVIIKAKSKEEADKIINEDIKFFRININYDDIEDDMNLTYKVINSSEENGVFHYLIEEILKTSYVLILPEDFNDKAELERLLELEMCLKKYPITRIIELEKIGKLNSLKIKDYIKENFLDDNIEYNYLTDRTLYNDIIESILEELHIVAIDTLGKNRIAKRVGETNNRNAIREIVKDKSNKNI